MGERSLVRRRNSVDVLGYAVLVGLVAAVPAALLVLAALGVGQALLAGEGWEQAWASLSLTDDDWELVPLILLFAVVCGALTAIPTTAVWLTLIARTRHRRSADVGAALVAAAVPFALLVVPPLASCGVGRGRRGRRHPGHCSAHRL